MELAVTPDATAAALAEEIAQAREAIIEVLQRERGTWRQAADLKAEVRNGWSDGAMSIALSRLLREGLLEVDGDKVRLTG